MAQCSVLGFLRFPGTFVPELLIFHVEETREFLEIKFSKLSVFHLLENETFDFVEAQQRESQALVSEIVGVTSENRNFLGPFLFVQMVNLTYFLNYPHVDDQSVDLRVLNLLPSRKPKFPSVVDVREETRDFPFRKFKNCADNRPGDGFRLPARKKSGRPGTENSKEPSPKISE